MNKSNIEWCDYTWNPVTGCLHGCDYCYARRIAGRFRPKDLEKEALEGLFLGFYSGKVFPHGFAPTLYLNRINEPQKMKKPSKIFVCSMADLFGDWVPDEWIEEVYNACQRADHHTYIFLTKNPKRYSQVCQGNLDFRGNMWLGTTITCQEDAEKFAKDFTGQANAFLSIEPLLGEIDLTHVKFDGPYHVNLLEEDDDRHFYNVNSNPIKWVIIGAQTGPGAVQPKKEWVQSIIDQCRRANISVFLKDNLKWPEKIQEFPEGV